MGTEFEVDAFLRRSRLAPLKVWRRGERLLARTGGEAEGQEPKHGQSGFAALVSAASFRRPGEQASDALAFLKRYEVPLAALAQCPGVEAVWLDFGVEDLPAEHQTTRFAPELLRLMGQLNIGLVVTRYPETA